VIQIIKKALKNSLDDLRRNSILFLPEVVYFLFLSISIAVAVAFTGILPVLQSIADQPDIVIEEALLNFFADNAAKIFATFIVFFFANFVVGSSLEAMKLGLVAAIIKKKKADFALLLASRRYTFKIIGVRLLQFILYMASIVIGVVAFLLLYKLNPQLAFGVGTAVSVAGFFVIYLSLFYTYPYLYLKNLRAADSLKESNKYFMKNKKMVLKIALTSFAVILLVNILMAVLDKVTMEKASFVFSLLSYFVITIYMPLFVFHTFEGKTKRQ